MKSNTEIRKSVAQTLKNRWFWRVFIVIVVLGVMPQAVNRLLNWAFAENGIQTWQDFSNSWMNAHRAGLDYAVPSLRVGLEMTGSSLFMTFIVYVFLAISALGIAAIALKAVRNDANQWFTTSLSGFKRPLELVWFLFVLNFRIALWALLLVIPGIVAMYRYRNGWYLKCEHPEWTVSKCLAESSRQMAGHKWQAFSLDVHYLVWMIVAVLFWGTSVGLGFAIGGTLVHFAVSILSLMAFGWLIQLMVALTVARAEFYREVQFQCSSKSSESLS